MFISVRKPFKFVTEELESVPWWTVCQKYVILLLGLIIQSKMNLLYLLLLVPSVSVGTDFDCCFYWKGGGGAGAGGGGSGSSSGSGKDSNLEGIII